MQEEFNVPDKQSYYLMQIALQVVRMAAKDPKSIKLEDFKLTFGKKKPVVVSDPNADYGTLNGIKVKAPRLVTKKDVEDRSKKHLVAVVEARRQDIKNPKSAVRRMPLRDK